MGQMTADVLMGCDWGYCWCAEALTPAWFLFVSSSRLVPDEGLTVPGERVAERRLRGDEEPLVS